MPPCATAVQETKGPLFIAAPVTARGWTTSRPQTYRAAPDDLARLGFAVAHALDPERARRSTLCRQKRARWREQIAQA